MHNLSGGYLVYKPRGLTSRQVDNRIGKLLKTRHIGHVGTLDPLAEGILPVLIGNATVLAQFVDSGVKSYICEIVLGIATDTDDSTGQIIKQLPVQLSPQKIFDELKKFVGKIEQMPPKFSAQKTDGVPAYKIARSGGSQTTVPVRPKIVEIFSIDNIEIEIPKVRFNIICATGTYLRSIARDLGDRLGCGGHLAALTRTAVGPHTVEKAIPLNEIEASIQNKEPQKYLLTETQLLPHIPTVIVNPGESWRVSHGQIILGLGKQFNPGELFKIVTVAPTERLIAIAERNKSGYKYRRVMK